MTDRRDALDAVIVDDERLAREGLEADIAALKPPAPLRVVASCADGFAAIEAVRRLKPDVLLLDVEMPELDGFGVLERLEPEDVPPAVVFVTAYDAYALQAFEARALDYLVKPVAPARLAEAVARAAVRVREARALREEVARTGQEELSAAPLERLVVKDRDRTAVVPVDTIRWIEGATYYVRVHVPGGAWLLRERMSVLESRLPAALFYRSHRSAIVRLALVREVRSRTRYEHEVILEGGTAVPLARERKAGLEGALAARRPAP